MEPVKTRNPNDVLLLLAYIGLYLDNMAFTIYVPLLKTLKEILFEDNNTLALWLSVLQVTFIVFVFPYEFLVSPLLSPAVALVAVQCLLSASYFILVLFVDEVVYFAVRGLQGCIAIVFWSSAIKVVTQGGYTVQERAVRFGLVFAASSLGEMSGPVVGGFLADEGGFSMPFLVVAGVGFVNSLATVAFGRWVPGIKGSKAPSRSLCSNLATGLRVLQALLTDPVCLIIYLAMGLVGLFIGLVDFAIPVHLSETYGYSKSHVGGVFLAASVLVTITSYVAGCLAGVFSPGKMWWVGMVLVTLLLPWGVNSYQQPWMTQMDGWAESVVVVAFGACRGLVITAGSVLLDNHQSKVSAKKCGHDSKDSQVAKGIPLLPISYEGGWVTEDADRVDSYSPEDGVVVVADKAGDSADPTATDGEEAALVYGATQMAYFAMWCVGWFAGTVIVSRVEDASRFRVPMLYVCGTSLVIMLLGGVTRVLYRCCVVVA